MSEETNFTIRLSKAVKEFNVGRDTIVEFLAKKGFQVENTPNTKLTADMYALLVKEYQGEKEVKNEAMKLGNRGHHSHQHDIIANEEDGKACGRA